MKNNRHLKSTGKNLTKCAAIEDKHSEPLADGQRERFCQFILTERSATAAAIKAGYAAGCAKVTAARLMKNREVQGRVAYLLTAAADKRILRKRDVLVIASQRARACYADIIDLIGITREELKERIDSHPFGRAIKNVKYEPDAMGVMRVAEVKLYDARDSYRDLAEFLGWMEPEKVEVSGNIGIVYLPEPKRVTGNDGMETASGTAD